MDRPGLSARVEHAGEEGRNGVGRGEEGRNWLGKAEKGRGKELSGVGGKSKGGEKRSGSWRTGRVCDALLLADAQGK